VTFDPVHLPFQNLFSAFSFLLDLTSFIVKLVKGITLISKNIQCKHKIVATVSKVVVTAVCRGCVRSGKGKIEEARCYGYKEQRLHCVLRTFTFTMIHRYIGIMLCEKSIKKFHNDMQIMALRLQNEPPTQNALFWRRFCQNLMIPLYPQLDNNECSLQGEKMKN
jgi:hypothetical protein